MTWKIFHDRMLRIVFVCLCLAISSTAAAQSSPPSTPLYITMHTAPIENYCPPCMASERLLKEAHLEFKKVLEPMGPWPWFLLTDKVGNQRILRGGLTQEDIEKIKVGEWPDHR